ncbi:ribosomal RNA adenine methyltransferase KsgA/Erm [Phycomyces nitens]|nr:ribosomal RNA adenine methyltransferase KsgA/Erm [Phycomyces nitens]
MLARRNIISKIPDLKAWARDFKPKNNGKIIRHTLSDYSFAEKGLQSLNLKNLEKKVAVEIYPGLGVWSNALVNNGFKRVYCLEPYAPYFKHLEELGSKSEDSIIPMKLDGYEWEVYSKLKEPQYLGGIETPDWSKINPNIFFTGTLPMTSRGEQLMAQLASCINNKMALYTMGRIEMAMWMPDILYTKLISPPGSSTRCKMSVVIEACADIKTVYSIPETAVYPNTKYHLVHLVPFENSKINANWDVFEYVLKHLFVMQRQPLKKMVKTLGPGADIILKRLSFDPSILVGQMTIEQIDQVAVKFDQWPLRPRVLFEDASMFS